MRVTKAPRKYRRAAWVLVAYLILVGAVGLWATEVDVPIRGTVNEFLRVLRDNGLTSVRYGHIEALANLALFLPLGFLLVPVLRPHDWWWAVVICLGLSVAIESAQFALPRRTPASRDVVFNTAGALVGAVLGQVTLLLIRARRRRQSRLHSSTPS